MGKRSLNKGKRGEREAAAEIRKIFGTDACRGRQFCGGPDSPDIQTGIYGLASAAEIQQAAMDESEYEDEEEFADDTEADPILYIVEGGQLGYGTKTAWDAAH